MQEMSIRELQTQASLMRESLMRESLTPETSMLEFLMLARSMVASSTRAPQMRVPATLERLMVALTEDARLRFATTSAVAAARHPSRDCH